MTGDIEQRYDSRFDDWVSEENERAGEQAMTKDEISREQLMVYLQITAAELEMERDEALEAHKATGDDWYRGLAHGYQSAANRIIHLLLDKEVKQADETDNSHNADGHGTDDSRDGQADQVV